MSFLASDALRGRGSGTPDELLAATYVGSQLQQYGIEPQQLFGYLQEQGQLPAMFADVRRALAIAEVIRAATVTDTAGNTIDTSEFFGKRSEADEDSGDVVESDQADAEQ